jgi:hypothetical protein
LVEVMMAATILVVGFMGVIQAVTIGSELQATARRQTIAALLIAQELELARLESWATLSSLSTTTTWSSGAAYAVGNVVRYQGGWYRCTAAHNASATLTPETATHWMAYMTYDAAATYARGDLVYDSTAEKWYRYINLTAASGNATSSTAYWTEYSGVIPSTGKAEGVTFTITRNVTSLSTNYREITVVVSWSKGGTTAEANAVDGSWLNRLSFGGASPISRNYTRKGTAYYGKDGLSLTYQRS